MITLRFVWLLLALCILFPGLPAAQSLDEALAAYSNGQYAKALKLFRAAAEAGNREAQHNLGFMYHDGKGTKRDDAEAMVWYRKAADQGFAPSEFDLGVMYAEGEGVRPDPATALVWFRKAADHGFLDAQVRLGEMAFVNSDFPEAFRWFKKAADQGDERAAFNVGSLYQTGRGVEKNEAKAVEYYRKSGEIGAGVLKQMGKGR
jgi:TPR repeat protein